MGGRSRAVRKVQSPIPGPAGNALPPKPPLPSSSAPSPAQTTDDKEKCSKRPGNIESQPWYHGFRTRNDVIKLLAERSDSLPGDWLIRATEGRNVTELVISLLNEARTVVNLTIKYDENSNKWELGLLSASKKVKHFDTVLHLVNYYRAHGLPGNLSMKRAIYREKWLVRHELITFDKTKDLLGSGNFCDVYKAKFEQTEKNFIDVAVKVCHSNPNETPEEAQNAREAMNLLVREGRIMSFYSHENVIQFYGVACDHKPIIVVMEFCSGGGLDTHLQREGETIEVGERILFCYEAAKGMNYLHRQGTVHRDLAARNCLISHKGVVKIADFGLSDMVNVAERQVLKQQVPLRWMAPESLVRLPIYSRKTDVWSFGVLMFEIFNLGEKPWPTEEHKRIATWIRRVQMPELPKSMPVEVREIVKNIWVKDADARPEFKKILADLFDVHHNKIRPPDPAKCSTNRLPGVVRGPFDERLEELKHRMIDLNQNTKDMRTRESGLDEPDVPTATIANATCPLKPPSTPQHPMEEGESTETAVANETVATSSSQPLHNKGTSTPRKSRPGSITRRQQTSPSLKPKGPK